MIERLLPPAIATPLRRELLLVVSVGVALALLPLGLSRFTLSVATSALIFAIAGIGWNVLAGYAGQFSFGHAAYFGIGAYTVAVSLTRFSLSPWVGIPLGGALAAIFGVATTALIFRYGIRGPYFALATFALAEMLRLISNNLELVNKGIGIHIPLVGGDSWARLQFEETPQLAYYVILGVMLLALVATILVMRGRVGHYLQSIREDEGAAESLGVRPISYLLVAVAISAFITAAAGGFYPQVFLFVDPVLAFGPIVSVDILMRPIIGGVGTAWGPVVGAGVIAIIGELTRMLVRNPPAGLAFLEGVNGLDGVIFGVILIGVIVAAPDGLIGVARRARAGRSGR